MDAKPRKPYPSDLSDAQWAILEPLLPPPVSAGAPRTTPLREVLNAIFYLLSTGCAWSALPHDLPPEGTVRDYFQGSSPNRVGNFGPIFRFLAACR